jgi:hypothetical protein
MISTGLYQFAVYSICFLVFVILSWHFVFQDRRLHDDEDDDHPRSNLVFAQEDDIAAIELPTIQLPEPAIIWDS